MVTVSSSSYSKYEASNLQNVEFFNADGSIIPSWLESGNTNAAQSTVYWLYIANGIQAASNITVYMGFASLTTDVMNIQTTGEAPQLSPAYGQYDDGSIVFPILYQDFAGTSCPTSWKCSGVTLDNGVSVPYNSYVLTDSSDYGMNSNQMLDFYGTFPIATSAENAWFGYTTSSSALEGSGVVEAVWGINTHLLGNGYAYGLVGDEGNWHAATSYFITGENVYSVYWPSTNPLFFSYNYGSGATISQSYTCDCQLTIGGANTQGGQAALGPFYWVRIRAYPPNGTMPSSSTRTAASAVTVSATCSPSSVTLGSSSLCTATVTGTSPSGMITWATSGAGTFSPSSCTLASGTCSVAYSPSTPTSPQTITANYEGDSKNAPASGTFSISVNKSVSTTTVTCLPSPVAEGSSSTCTAVVGGYSPTGTVAWASSGVANFSPSSECPLSAGSCAVTYTPSASSPVTVTATYIGDQDNVGSSGLFILEVNTTTTTTPTVTITTTTTVAATTIATTSTATTTATSVMTTTLTGPTETITGPASTTTTTQIVTSTTTQSSSSAPTWAYAIMGVLLIVGLAVGYTIKRPSASNP